MYRITHDLIMRYSDIAGNEFKFVWVNPTHEYMKDFCFLAPCEGDVPFIPIGDLCEGTENSDIICCMLGGDFLREGKIFQVTKLPTPEIELVFAP